MNAIEQAFENWKKSLPTTVDIAGLYQRNPIAHKWKVTFQSLILREAICWRLHDLLTQAYALHQKNHRLGTLILIRSGIETLATLIRLNQFTANVLEGSLDFQEFTYKIHLLLLGSRNEITNYKATNIKGVVENCDRQYNGINKIYADLSEIAHPNFEGVCMAYSKNDQDNNYVVPFSNYCTENPAEPLELIELCIKTFEEEYNNVWTSQFEKLEEWLVANDTRLHATKNGAL